MESKWSRKSIHIGMPWSLLFIPVMFIAAGVSIPVNYLHWRIQRRREHLFLLEMAARDRVIAWQDFIQAIDDYRGTVIEERFSFKGPVRWWWTAEKVRDSAPCEIADWLTMLKDSSYRPFVAWCRQRYTSVDQGHALLVAVEYAPKDEVRAIRSRFPPGSRETTWVEVVPPESLR